MPKVKLPKTIKDEAASFVTLRDEAKDKTNEANRQKTKLKNAVKSFWLKESLPIGSYVRAAGHEFLYAGADKREFDKEAIVDLYDNEEITRDQFIRLMSVDAKQLANVLGADQAADLTIETVGDTLDIRIKSLSVEDEDDEFVMEHRNVKKKRKRSVFGQRKDAVQSTVTRKAKRSVRVKRD